MLLETYANCVQDVGLRCKRKNTYLSLHPSASEAGNAYTALRYLMITLIAQVNLLYAVTPDREIRLFHMSMVSSNIIKVILI